MKFKRRNSPLAAAGKGLIAGIAGTGLMSAYQTAVLKARGSEPSSTPAAVGERVIGGVLRRPVPERWKGALNNAVHFLYGASWGPAYGIVHASKGGGTIRGGIGFGTAVWSASLVELPLMKIAPPVWEYPPGEAALDLSYHLVYGLGVASAFAALER